MLQVGALLDNKYKILSEIGHGGMSVVYLAINERANKTWAVKEIRKDGVCNFEAVKQGLVVETDMLKKLNHSHLPSIIDVIDLDDSFIIVMDYIEGQSLQSVLKKTGAQPKEKVIAWGKQLCDVLGYLHSRQPAIIYRDMKPANVMLKPDGDVTLIDFGTAREFKDRSMVEDTTCLGTRGYAAPEQFGGRGQTDARTDIYCLGATMYHLLTGHSPAEPPYEIKPLSYWDPNLAGSGLEYVINKCCQQDPAARYQTCAELLYDLEHVEDMDYSVMRSRKKKWLAFLCSAIVCVLGVVGMIFAGIGKNAAIKETYDYYLTEASTVTGTTEFLEFVGYIKEAIAVDPGRYEAYDMLLSHVERDGRLDAQTEWTVIQECLGGISGSGSKKNEVYLQESNRDGFAEIQFRVGKLLFLMSNGEDVFLAKSSLYFDKALEDGGLKNAVGEDKQKEARLAEALRAIGQYIERLDDQSQTWVESEHTYKTLWDDLNDLVKENPIDSLGSKAYGIALYNRVAGLVLNNYREFLNEGVSAQTILTLLEQIETELNQIEQTLTISEHNRGFDELISGALDNVTTARNMIGGIKEGQ